MTCHLRGMRCMRVRGGAVQCQRVYRIVSAVLRRYAQGVPDAFKMLPALVLISGVALRRGQLG